MKSYIWFLVLLVIFHLAYETYANVATEAIQEVSDCMRDDLKTSLKCIANISTPLYNDIKSVSGKFVKVIEEHVEQWANSLQRQSPSTN